MIMNIANLCGDFLYLRHCSKLIIKFTLFYVKLLSCVRPINKVTINKAQN